VRRAAGAEIAISRIEVPPVILAVAALAALYGWAVVALTPTHPGSIGLNLDALGTDWMVFYGGVRCFFDGNLAGLFDGERFTTYLNSAFAGWLSQPLILRAWLYPPTTLLAMLPFGLLPFALSYAAFQVATAGLLAAVLWFGADRPNARIWAIGAALLGPAAAINAAMGQNAFLTTALLVGGFRVLRTRPALGGIILGLLTIKPQLWLLVPVALAAGREWRALAWSLAAAAALAVASLLVFGVEIWRQWLELALGGIANPQYASLEFNRVWGDSIYACLVSSGLSHALATIAQGLGTLLGAGLAYSAFRRPLPGDRKIVVLLAAAILAAPHSSLADTVLLATAVGLWIGDAAQGDASLAAWTAALAIWLAPVFNPPMASPVGRLTPLLILAFIIVTMTRRAQPDRVAVPMPRPPLAAGEQALKR